MSNLPLSDHYIAHVESAIAAAKSHSSKLLPFHLGLDGMSSIKGRHLFNNILSVKASVTRPTRYLEVGTWKGSTLCSALFNNAIEAVAIDNFSQFLDVSFVGAHGIGPRAALAYHLSETARLASVQSNMTFMDADAFTVDPATLGDPFDVYFYDGEHVGWAQKRAFTHFAPALQSTFIAIVDDAKDEATRQATIDGIKEAGYTIARDWYLYEETEQTIPGLRSGWWNGIYIAVCTKKGDIS